MEKLDFSPLERAVAQLRDGLAEHASLKKWMGWAGSHPAWSSGH